MSLNKYFTIVILISCLLILSNGVYAENTTNTETTNNNIEQTYVTSPNELKNAITNIETSTNENHEINLKQGTYNLSKSFSGKIYSPTEKNIVINGNHSTINGKDLTGFLIIPKNVKININNLTITNMKRSTAPAIRNSGKLILENIIFENNKANDTIDQLGGGSLFTEETTDIINCTFQNNGGNIDGSAIYIKNNAKSDNIINIINCRFNNNTSLKSSTIKMMGLTTTNIINSTFTNENANHSIIGNTNTILSIDNCTFSEENSPNIITTDGESKINNTLIYNNNVNKIIISNYNLHLNNSRIYENKAKTIINYTANVTGENTIINNNEIQESIISNKTENTFQLNTLKINNVTIANNTANKTCGIRNDEINNQIFIENSWFVNNTSLEDEGILYDFSGKLHVKNTHFYNNTCEDLFKGNNNTFVEVKNNEYLGNYLKTYLKSVSTIQNNHLIINGTLETDEIYNTTINTGKLILKQDNTTVYEENVTNNKFTIDYQHSNDLNKYTLFYDGITNFRNTLSDIEIVILEEEYEFEIRNISKNYIYGNYITFDLFIRNSGKIPVNNIKLSNVIPNELVYAYSDDDFDIENNEYYLNTLEINENKTIRFHLIPNEYDDLYLEFNIADVKQNKTYQLQEEIQFIKPKLTVENIISHPGDVINISARLNNYNKSTLGNIKFIFNYKEVNEFEYSLIDNILCIENYKLSESLTRKNYMIKIVCNENGLNEFYDTSLVSVIKYETHSVMYYNISNSYLNLSIKILDENNNNVNSGSVFLKVNGKTVKTLKVINGIAILENYRLKSNYDNEYNITITYTGNNKYNMHYNNVTVKEFKKTIDFIINYNIRDNVISFNILVVCDDNVLPESGIVAVKINEKTILPRMNVQNEYFLTYNIDEIPFIHNITVAYYGNENFVHVSKTIRVNE